MLNIYSIPLEIVLYMIEFLSIHDKCSFMMTCKWFSQSQGLRKHIGNMKKIHYAIQKQRYHKEIYRERFNRCYPNPIERACERSFKSYNKLIQTRCTTKKRRNFYRKVKSPNEIYLALVEYVWNNHNNPKFKASIPVRVELPMVNVSMFFYVGDDNKLHVALTATRPDVVLPDDDYIIH